MTADRVRQVARGVLAGEALSWPNAGYRIRLLPPKRLARMEVLAAFGREHGTTTPAVPYAHSSPVASLQPGAGEASEWFAFTAAAMQRAHGSGDLGPLDDAWQRLAEAEGEADRSGSYRIGTRIALENLRRGLPAPQSGNDNPHYFDDMPMVRAIAAAAVFDDEAGRREAARRDAAFTAARDGLWCADATAALFSGLLDGHTVQRSVEDAVAVLPEESWARRMAGEALEVSARSRGALDRAVNLAATVGDHVYSYATVAPETFAFLVAHLVHADSPGDLMLGVLAQPRNAATLPALAGAAAALFGDAWIPERLNLDCPLTGVSVAALAGTPIADALRATS